MRVSEKITPLREMPLQYKIPNSLGSGVYEIFNVIEKKRYIGSSKNLSGRWRDHIKNLNRNIHYSKLMQNSFNQFGIETFRFTIIEFLPVGKILTDREQFWMNHFKSYDPNFGYNTLKTVTCGHLIPISDELRSKKRRISATKLDDEKVKEIKKLLNEGVLCTEISKKFNIGSSHVTQIKNGDCWSDIECNNSGYIFGNTKGSRSPNAKINEEDVDNIRYLFKFLTQLEISKLYNISDNTVGLIVSGRRWGHIPNENIYNSKANLKLDDYDVAMIRKLIKFLTRKEIAKIYNVSINTISGIIYNNARKNIEALE